MEYSIKATEKECVETLKLSDGSTYEKIHKKTDFGSECFDPDFITQMRIDGICEEIREIVSGLIDGVMVSDCFEIAEIED